MLKVTIRRDEPNRKSFFEIHKKKRFLRNMVSPEKKQHSENFNTDKKFATKIKNT